MPKKRRAIAFKPQTSAHPSLSSSSPTTASASSHDSSVQQARSVNELIQRSRRTHSNSNVPAADALTPTPTIQSLPLANHAPHQALFAAPTPAGRRRPRRGPPGPLPPPSWSSPGIPPRPSIYAPPYAGHHHAASVQPRAPGEVVAIPLLPGQPMPSRRSLQDTVLRSISQNWSWHVEHDGEWLDVIPVALKSALFVYLSCCSIAITPAEFRLLLPPETPGTNSLDGEATAENWESEESDQALTHLSIGTCMGPKLSWRQLVSLCSNKVLQPSWAPHTTASSSAYIPTAPKPKSLDVSELTCASSRPASPRPYQPSFSPPGGQQSNNGGEEAFVDSYPNPIPTGFSLYSSPLHNLTHLSVARAPSPSYSQLISVLLNLPYLTHLSLCHWELPESLNVIAPLTASSPARTSADPQVALSTLRRIGKSSPKLEWLDLTGPGRWAIALQAEEYSPATEMIDFEHGNGDTSSQTTLDGNHARIATGNLSLVDASSSGAPPKRSSIWASAVGSLKTLRLGPCGCGQGPCVIPAVLQQERLPIHVCPTGRTDSSVNMNPFERPQPSYGLRDGKGRGTEDGKSCVSQGTSIQFDPSQASSVHFPTVIGGRSQEKQPTHPGSIRPVTTGNWEDEEDIITQWIALPISQRFSMRVRELLALRVNGIRLERRIRAHRLESNIKHLECSVEMEGGITGLDWVRSSDDIDHVKDRSGPVDKRNAQEQISSASHGKWRLGIDESEVEMEPRLAPWTKYIAERWLGGMDIGIGWSWSEYSHW